MQQSTGVVYSIEVLCVCKTKNKRKKKEGKAENAYFVGRKKRDDNVYCRGSLDIPHRMS